MIVGVWGRDIEKVWALVTSLGAMGGARPILSEWGLEKKKKGWRLEIQYFSLALSSASSIRSVVSLDLWVCFIYPGTQNRQGGWEAGAFSIFSFCSHMQ